MWEWWIGLDEWVHCAVAFVAFVATVALIAWVTRPRKSDSGPRPLFPGLTGPEPNTSTYRDGWRDFLSPEAMAERAKLFADEPDRSPETHVPYGSKPDGAKRPVTHAEMQALRERVEALEQGRAIKPEAMVPKGFALVSSEVTYTGPERDIAGRSRITIQRVSEFVETLEAPRAKRELSVGRREAGLSCQSGGGRRE